MIFMETRHMNGRIDVSFISCVNNEKEYKRCVDKINSLDCAPYTYEIVPIRNAKSMTSGYNIGMKLAKGKYKFYLHQDVYIANKHLIQDIIDIFDDKDIGVVGMVGTDCMPSNGLWFDSKHIYGGVIESSISETNELRPFPTEPFTGGTKDVVAVDGLFMATQYDVPWREDILDGWDFYDVSQCIEFKRRGYRVCVPNQENGIWMIHDCLDVNLTNFYKYRKVFLREYAKDLYKFFGLLIPLLYDLKKKQRKWQKPIERFIKNLIKKNHTSE